MLYSLYISFLDRHTRTMTGNYKEGKNLYTAPDHNGNKDAYYNIPSTSERDGAFIPSTDDSGYRIQEQPYGTKRRVRVILMGAGASTINFLRKSEQDLSDVEIAVYEKNNDIGGTWLEVTLVSNPPLPLLTCIIEQISWLCM